MSNKDNKVNRSLLSFLIPYPRTMTASNVWGVFREMGFSKFQIDVWGDRPTKIIMIDLKTHLGSSKEYARFDSVIERLGAYYARSYGKWIIRY